MVRGGTINADQSRNNAQRIIATHGQTSKLRHHNRSQKVRRENQQQQALAEPKINAWPPPETKDNDDEDEKSDDSDDSENFLSPGPKSSDSEGESSTDEEATAKSTAIHARDHLKKEQEKKAAAQMKKRQAKEKLLHWLCLPQGITSKQ
jgi:hypothetical protein